MSSEGKEIRDMLDEVRKVYDASLTPLKENYVFPTNTHSKPVEEHEIPEMGLKPEMKPEAKVDPIKGKINSIRTTAISLMGEIDPTDRADDYKAIRAILDACDKLITVKPVGKTEIK